MFQSFKWQEGDSQPLIGESEVFSEVERHGRRQEIKPNSSELIAEGVFEAGSGPIRVRWTLFLLPESETAAVLF